MNGETMENDRSQLNNDGEIDDDVHAWWKRGCEVGGVGRQGREGAATAVFCLVRALGRWCWYLQQVERLGM